MSSGANSTEHCVGNSLSADKDGQGLTDLDVIAENFVDAVLLGEYVYGGDCVFVFVRVRCSVANPEKEKDPAKEEDAQGW